MIRRSGINLYWQRCVCCVMVLAIAGCDKTAPDTALSGGSTPTPRKTSHDEAPAEPITEVAEPELAPSAEVASTDLPVAVEQAPAKTEQKPIAPAPVPAPAPSAANKPKVALSVPNPPAYVYEPQVLLSQRDADSCLVKTGEPFPIAQLSDLEGQQRSLKELYGEKLTLVVFWSNSNRLGREQIQRLEAETVSPFQNTGLSVVAINISDPPEQIGDLLPADREPGFTVLLDTDGSFFSKVATGGHPRSYLLDAAGNVLWFDIEYSRGMSRDLVNAIHVYLGDRKPGDS